MRFLELPGRDVWDRETPVVDVKIKSSPREGGGSPHRMFPTFRFKTRRRQNVVIECCCFLIIIIVDGPQPRPISKRLAKPILFKRTYRFAYAKPGPAKAVPFVVVTFSPRSALLRQRGKRCVSGLRLLSETPTFKAFIFCAWARWLRRVAFRSLRHTAVSGRRKN